MSTATPIQTLVDTTQDPGLQYLSPRPVNNVIQATVPTNAGNVTTRFVPVEQAVYNIFNTNVTSTASPSGSNGDIQFNSNGQFSSDVDLDYNSETDTLSIKNLNVLGTITFSDESTQTSALTSGGGSSFSGNYNDLTNKPTLFDGDYNSLTNKPTIPSGFDSSQIINLTNTTSSTTTTTGALKVAGGVGINGNINVGGNKHIFNGNLHVTGVDSHTIYLGSYADASNFNAPLLVMKNAYETFVQSALINASQNGSADWVAYGDQGSDESGWADMGFTSHNFNDINYTITGSGDGYFFVKGQTGFDGQGGNLVIATGSTGTTKDIIFGTGGFYSDNIFARISHSNNSLELKRTGSSITFADGTIQTTAYTGQTGGASTGNLTIYDTAISSNTDVIIRAGQYASPAPGFFKFASDGTFELPFGIKQVTTGTVVCNANADTVIYTGTSQGQHSFKLLLKVEGMEDGQTDWDTQTCEMTIAKSFRNNNVVGSVYGLVYTSTNPLATFTTRWNSSTSRVEVLCRPTSLSHGVEVVSSITEITTSA